MGIPALLERLRQQQLLAKVRHDAQLYLHKQGVRQLLTGKEEECGEHDSQMQQQQKQQQQQLVEARHNLRLPSPVMCTHTHTHTHTDQPTPTPTPTPTPAPLHTHTHTYHTPRTCELSALSSSQPGSEGMRGSTLACFGPPLATCSCAHP